MSNRAGTKPKKPARRSPKTPAPTTPARTTPATPDESVQNVMLQVRCPNTKQRETVREVTMTKAIEAIIRKGWKRTEADQFVYEGK